MDHQPSSQCSARAAHRGRKSPDSPRLALWIVAGLTLVIVFSIGSFSIAQEEVEPQAAIMAPLATKALTLDIGSAGGALVAVGERGHILVSSDGGATWQQSQSPTRAGLTAVYLLDRNIGWAVGHDSAILRTTDGGSNWELVYWAPEDEAPFFDVWFSDAENGFAIGAYGSYFVTSDGGSSWSYEPIGEDDFHLHDMARAADGHLYIAAEAGMVYRSDDGGATWIELPSPYDGSFFGVLPLDNESVLLFGLRGHLFRSDDAGQTWRALETGTVAMLTAGVRMEDGTIVVVGLGGAVLVSSDGGQSFHLHQQANRRGISAVVETQDGLLHLVGEFGVRAMSFAELAPVSD